MKLALAILAAWLLLGRKPNEAAPRQEPDTGDEAVTPNAPPEPPLAPTGGRVVPRQVNSGRSGATTTTTIATTTTASASAELPPSGTGYSVQPRDQITRSK